MVFAGNVKSATFNTSTNDAALIAAVPGKSIRILSVVAQSAGAVFFSLTHGESSTVILGPFNSSAAVVSVPYCEHGWGETGQGEALKIGLTAAVITIGTIIYTEV